MAEEIIKQCKRCGAKLHFKRVSKNMGMWRTMSPSLTKKNTPNYCRRCYAPDKGIDLREVSLLSSTTKVMCIQQTVFMKSEIKILKKMVNQRLNIKLLITIPRMIARAIMVTISSIQSVPRLETAAPVPSAAVLVAVS